MFVQIPKIILKISPEKDCSSPLTPLPLKEIFAINIARVGPHNDSPS